MVEFSKRLMMPTDVAHIVLFHPDDLAHAAEWPIAWYSEPFIFPVESAAGRLIAWCTGSDGGFSVRLTNGAMSEREQAYAGPSWTFPYTVRHGRLYLDNTDALPGVEQMTRTSDHEDYWIEVPNGDYAVKVTAVEWNAEPGAREKDFDKLPNYVVQFLNATSQETVVARRPPDLECLVDGVASDKPYSYTAKEPEPPDFGRAYPAFVSRNVCRPGQQFTTEGEAPIEAGVVDDGNKFAHFDTTFVSAAELVPGAPAVVLECRGSGGMPGKSMHYDFRARQAVRIVEIVGMFRGGKQEPLGTTGLFRRKQKPVPPDALAAVRIAQLAPGADTPATVSPDVLRARVIKDLRNGGVLGKNLGGVAEYEARRLEASGDAEILLNWLNDTLPLPPGERLRMAVLPPNARCAALSEAYGRS